MAGVLYNCSELEEEEGVVGPVQMFESMGHWVTAVYIILVLHVLPTWIVSAFTLYRLNTSCSPELRSSLAWLVCVPPSLMSLATTGILVPSFGIYIELSLEIVLVVGMVQFVRFSTLLCRGVDSMVQACSEQKIRLPIGAPPFVCLLLCRSPPINKISFHVVRHLPTVFLVVKVTLLIVEIIQRSTSTTISTEFFSLQNLHNVLAIPVGLAGIYSYTMYLIIVAQLLSNSPHRGIGFVLLIEYVLFDSQRLFFIFLSGTGMLTCVPPSVPQFAVQHFLKNILKGFLTMFVGLPYLKLCGIKADILQPLVDGGSISSSDVSTGSASLSEDSSSFQERSARHRSNGDGRRRTKSSNAMV